LTVMPGLRPCLSPRCPKLARAGSRCREHAREYERARPSRLRGRRLQELRRQVFAEQPVCAICAATRPWHLQDMSSELDHVVPLSQGGTDERSNLRGLCGEHHAAKTCVSDGGGSDRRRSYPYAGQILGDRQGETAGRLDFPGYGLGTFERSACKTGQISRDRSRETRSGPHAFECKF
jgi:5-methylcytosine-specific restriction enzyme A